MVFRSTMAEALRSNSTSTAVIITVVAAVVLLGFGIGFTLVYGTVLNSIRHFTRGDITLRNSSWIINGTEK